MENNTLFTSFSNGIYLGFGKGIQKNILDQNRMYWGLGWRFNDACSVQAGYLNQYIVKQDGFKVERNHILQLALTYNFNFFTNT